MTAIIETFITVTGGAIIYFLPSIVANFRLHKQVWPIMCCNLFLGWTIGGWLILVAWAFSEHTGYSGGKR